MGKSTLTGYTAHLAWKDLTSHPVRFVISILLFALPLFAAASIGTLTYAVDKYPTTFSLAGIPQSSLMESNADESAIEFDSTSATMTIDGVATQFALATIAPDQNTDTLVTQRIAPALASDTTPALPGEGEILLPRTIAEVAHLAPGDSVTFDTVGDDETPRTFTVTGVLNGTTALTTGLVTDPVYWLSWDNDGLITSSIVISTDVIPAYLLFILLAAGLTTPVFALGFRRMRRTLGTLAVNGAESRHLQAIAVWEGFFTSALGAATGTVLGLATAAVVLASTGSLGGFSITLDALSVLTLAVILAGLLSAWLPVRAKVTPAHWLTSDDLHIRRPRWYLVLGPVLLLLSLASENFLFVGIGILLSGPAALVLVQYLPLPYAAKLATRLTPRAGLATGAIGTLLFISMFGFRISYVTEDDYDDAYISGVVRVSTDIQSDDARLLGPQAHAILQRAHPRQEADLYSAHTSAYGSCSWLPVDVCSRYLVAEPTVLTMLSLTDEELRLATDATAQGHAVEFVSSHPADESDAPQEDPIPGLVVERVPTNQRLDGIFIPLNTARELGLKLQYEGAMGTVGDAFSPWQAARFRSASDYKAGFYANAIGVDSTVLPFFTVPVLFGWGTTFAAVLLLVIIASSYTRHSRELMVSVGAAPSFLRRLGMYQGFMVTAVAALLATVGLGMFLFVDDVRPTGWIFLVGAPVVGALTGWLASRKTAPALSRRP